MSDALLNKSDKKSVSDTVDSKKMPRAPPVDPEMRKKYKTELDAIENELDRIYSDPLGVWQEFMANPEKFLEENETGLAEDEDLQWSYVQHSKVEVELVCSLQYSLPFSNFFSLKHDVNYV